MKTAIERPAVFLGSAVFKSLEARAVESRDALAKANWRSGLDQGYELVDMGVRFGYGFQRNLEVLAADALAAGADLFIHHDADMWFEPSDIARLISTWKIAGPKAVVGAAYPAGDLMNVMIGTLPGVPTDPYGTCTAYEHVNEYVRDGSAVEATSLGFGLIALPTAMYADWEHPWFADSWDGVALLGPDVAMCARAKASGYMIACDFSVKPKHLERPWRSL